MERPRERSPLRHHDHRSGFTLLEVMVSIMLISLLIVIIGGAMRLGYRSIGRGEQKTETLERLKVSFTTMGAQIQSAIPLTAADDEMGRYFFEGKQDTFKFASNYSLVGGLRGYVVATYRVESDANNKRTLYIEENTIGVENKREMKLLEGLDDIRFEYFRKEDRAGKSPGQSSPGQSAEQTADQSAGEWVEEWSDDMLFPRKIRVYLAFKDRKVSLIIPVRAQRVTP